VNGHFPLARNCARVWPCEEDGWTVLATTVGSEVCTEAELLRAYQDQHCLDMV
jgi:hypothetical protein